MKISELGEFGLIARIAERFRGGLPVGVEGIGDDCAILPLDDRRSLVVTTDLLVEEVHFLRNHITPKELGYKAMAVNLSDVAAMGASPVGAFLSLALPADTEVEWCDRFLEGLQSLGTPLLGGDTTSSPNSLTINLAVIGIAENDRIKRRSAARIGDRIAVTSPLGESAAGLAMLLENLPRTGENLALLGKHHTPRPHLEEGRWLGGQAAVHAMMDLSDGLAADLPHILRASACSARIDLGAIPATAALRDFCARHGKGLRSLTLEGGEDYALLFTYDPTDEAALLQSYQAAFGRPFYPIGTTVETGDPLVVWSENGVELPLHPEGFHHF